MISAIFISSVAINKSKLKSTSTQLFRCTAGLLQNVSQLRAFSDQSNNQVLKRAVVFLGPKGAGKSFLINKLRGCTQAKMAHSDTEDDIIIYPDSMDQDLILVDTPGLDSPHFPARVVEQVQKLNRKVMISLVANKMNARFTCEAKFEQTLKYLIGINAKFCFVQTFSDIEGSEFNDYLKGFPFVQLYKDTELEKFRTSFSQQDLFHVPIANTAEENEEVEEAEPVKHVAPKDGELNDVNTNGAPVASKKLPLEFPIGLPHFLDLPNAFQSRQTKRGKFDDLCNEVLMLKVAGSREYRVLKLMGDAYLKPIVYSLIKRHSGNEMLETTSHLITDNAVGSAMPLFFDKHISVKHNIFRPNEEALISSHAKADVVEALIELARVKRDTFAFMFIIEELFVLAGMGNVVGK